MQNEVEAYYNERERASSAPALRKGNPDQGITFTPSNDGVLLRGRTNKILVTFSGLAPDNFLDRPTLSKTMKELVNQRLQLRDEASTIIAQVQQHL